MKNLFRNCLYIGRNSYRDKSFLFWVLIYPLILAMFFYIAFSGVMDMELKNIDVGISSESSIEFVLKEVEFLNIYKLPEHEVKERLQNEEIEGFIDDDLNLFVKKSGIRQTIIKEILDQIKQMDSLNVPIENFDFDVDYILDKNQKADTIIIVFYSLIAMVSAYGIFPGIEVTSFIQANLSNIGQRVNITPLKKIDFLLSGTIVSLVLNLLANGLLIGFMKYVLKLDLFTEIKYSLIFILIGNLFGIALGIFIGVSSKQNENVKTILGIVTVLILSFFSGMMSPDIKIMMDQKLPIMGKLNPISIITNNLYKVNLLGNTQNTLEGIIILCIYCMVLSLISYGVLRRKSYDSI